VPAYTCDRDTSASPFEKSAEESDGMKNIYVGNLSFNTGESELRGEFARRTGGESDRCHRQRNRTAARFRVCGDGERREAENAIKGLNGAILDGRTLNVNEARPKAANVGRREKSRARRF
jgi:RNA recognition motif-containing protein